MKLHDSKKHSNKIDVIMHGIETIGSAERSTDPEAMKEKLVTARVGLLLKQPFFGNLATRLKLVDASDWVPTAATDGRNFYYNSDFIDVLTPKETEFLFDVIKTVSAEFPDVKFTFEASVEV